MNQNQPPDKEQPNLADLGLDGGDLPADPFGKVLGDYDASGEDRPQTWTDHVRMETSRPSSSRGPILTLVIVVAIVAAFASLLVSARMGNWSALQSSQNAKVVVVQVKIAPWKWRAPQKLIHEL